MVGRGPETAPLLDSPSRAAALDGGRAETGVAEVQAAKQSSLDVLLLHPAGSLCSFRPGWRRCVYTPGDATLGAPHLLFCQTRDWRQNFSFLPMKPSPPSTDRRLFLKAGLASALGVPLLTPGQAQPATPEVFQETARDLPVNDDADVLICGAGPAGVSAAISAARAGAKVRLFETYGSLGGVWTSSLLGYLLDFDKPGFNVELVRRLRERDAINGGGMNGLSYQPEEMKLLLEELCATAGVKVQLHTRVAAAYREGRTLRTIVTESKSGR